MEARLVTCHAAGACNTTSLFETCIAPLKNALQPEKFVF
jgi:protein-L-isoaspartate(D-aspartate) O-methyltransferase